MVSQEPPEEEKDGSLSGATDLRAGLPRRPGYSGPRVCHVLLVEDDGPTRALITKLLTKCDYEGEGSFASGKVNTGP